MGDRRFCSVHEEVGVDKAYFFFRFRFSHDQDQISLGLRTAKVRILRLKKELQEATQRKPAPTMLSAGIPVGIPGFRRSIEDQTAVLYVNEPVIDGGTFLPQLMTERAICRTV